MGLVLRENKKQFIAVETMIIITIIIILTVCKESDFDSEENQTVDTCWWHYNYWSLYSVMNEIQVKKHSFTKYCTMLLKKALFPFNRKERIQDIFLHLYMKRATYAPAVIPQEKISRVQGTCKATLLAGLLLASAVHFLCKEGIRKTYVTWHLTFFMCCQHYSVSFSTCFPPITG